MRSALIAYVILSETLVYKSLELLPDCMYVGFYAPAIFNGGAYSITAVCTYVRPVPSVTLFVSVRYLLKGLVYWIEILYKGIYI